jgi:hypothetical protein
MIFAIDPGTRESGWVYFDPEARKVRDCGVAPNGHLLQRIRTVGGYVMAKLHAPVTLASEMMKARGMPTSNDEMQTLVWIGRFMQAWHAPDEVRLIYRQDVKLELCGTMRAKDPNVRQALIDLLGAPGTKKAPGPTYGVTSHAWPALAVAVVAAGGTKALAEPAQMGLAA